MKYSQELKFDSLRDVEEVKDGLAVDVDEMLRTGVVKDSSAILDNNSIDDPNQIIGRVTDEFAAIDAARAIRKYGKKSKPSQQKAVEGAAQPVPDPKVE